MTVTSVILGFTVLYLSSTLASSSGIGGGLLNVAIFKSIFGYSLNTSIALSIATIIGNASMQTYVNFTSPHPSKPTRQSIYWDLVFILLPAELAGSALGHLFSSSLPDSVTILLANIVLIIGIYLTGRKALKLYEKENIRVVESLMKGHDDSTGMGPQKKKETGSVHSDVNGGMNSNVTPFNVEDPKTVREERDGSISGYMQHVAHDMHKKLNDYQGADMRLSMAGAGTVDSEDDVEMIPKTLEYDWKMISMVALAWFYYFCITVAENYIKNCSKIYFVFFALSYVFVIFQTPLAMRYLRNQQKKFPSKVADGDIKWGPDLAWFPCVTFCIGITTSLLGIGGGELMGPFLLSIGVSLTILTFLSNYFQTSLLMISYIVIEISSLPWFPRVHPVP